MSSALRRDRALRATCGDTDSALRSACTAAIVDAGLDAQVHDRATRAAAMLFSKKWDFRPNRPGGFHLKAVEEITQLQQPIYAVYEALGAIE
jgi:hypothetical protein